jgi:hypothetical protein
MGSAWWWTDSSPDGTGAERVYAYIVGTVIVGGA